MKKNKPKVLVILAGGLIQSVFTNKDIDVVIADFDIEGELDEDGKDMLANVFLEPHMDTGIVKDKFYKELSKRLKYNGKLGKEDAYMIKELKKLDF
jgi:hypothetical protein